MRARNRTLRSEHGAVFVQVGISLFVLMSFNVFVLDYGVMWIGRRQAQNAADAGALAGAVARGYDDFGSPPSSGGLAALSAENLALGNLVWQQAGTASVTFACPAGVVGRCVQVDVYRNGEHASTPLPMLFGPILGITTQGVRASATAIAANGNATDCLRPIAFPDAWEVDRPPLNEFERYTATGTLLADPDVYTAPSGTHAGNTIVPADLGRTIIYRVDQQTIGTPPLAPITWEMLVSLVLDAPNYEDNIKQCTGDQVVQLGQTLPVQIPTPGDTERAFDFLRDLDPSATWNSGQRRVEFSCAPGCAQVSPRLISVALFDPGRFQLGRATNIWDQPDVGCPTNAPCITITNIVGFFVDGNTHGVAFRHGHYLKYPGITMPTAPTFIDAASWLVMPHLIR